MTSSKLFNMFKFLLIFVIAFSQHSFSQIPLSFSGTLTRKLDNPTHQKVTLMHVQLTREMEKTLKKNAQAFPFTVQKSHASSIQLGMHDVPVQDQGPHGSCVTFASMAAINALSGQSFSELCSLSLGQYLAETGYQSSGWDGQSIRQVLSRLDDFGIVSLSQQKNMGCGGMTEYPTQSLSISEPTSPVLYKTMSQSLQSAGMDSWSNFYDINQWLYQTIPAAQILNHTKEALRHEHRVLIGVLIPGMFGGVGALGQHHVANDTWIFTQNIENAINDIEHNTWLWGGHAMVITGYDDDAVAIDEQGHPHQGLFTLRNSWGSQTGDHGDYYMSYDYFMHLTVELEEIWGNN